MPHPTFDSRLRDVRAGMEHGCRRRARRADCADRRARCHDMPAVHGRCGGRSAGAEGLPGLGAGLHERNHIEQAARRGRRPRSQSTDIRPDGPVAVPRRPLRAERDGRLLRSCPGALQAATAGRQDLMREYAMTKTDTAEAVRYRVTGMDCSARAAKIEAAARSVAGVRDAKVSIASQEMILRTEEGTAALPEVERSITGLGYRLARIDADEDDDKVP